MRSVYLILFLFIGLKTYSQNLVPNGSFEDTIQCPNNQGQINFASGWQNPNTATPDYYHSCFNYIPGVQPKTGIAYSGIFTLVEPPFNNEREYIQCELLDSLVAGKKYCVSFYVLLPTGIEIACNSVGAFFSTSSVSSTNSTVLPYIPQVSNNSTNPLVNVGDWLKVSGTFTATGGERFLTIGNFENDANTDSVHLTPSPTYHSSYYAIDDVFVEECKEPTINTPNIFTPNGDGVNDIFSITGYGIENMSLEIYNRWGIKVAVITQPNQGWDGRTTSGEEAVEGVYYYVFSASGYDGKSYKQAGFFHLIK